MRFEFATMLLLLAIALFTALRLRSSREMTLAWQLLCCYVAAASGVYLLPNVTFVHHWIISTPFHYAATALAIRWDVSVGAMSLGVSSLSLDPDSVFGRAYRHTLAQQVGFRDFDSGGNHSRKLEFCADEAGRTRGEPCK
jgi:hypothetical protein